MTTRIRRPSSKGPLLWALLLLATLGGMALYFALYPEALPEWAAKTSIGRELQTTRVYKWQDASGAWHVSDRPPPPGVAYQTEEYTRDTNALPLPPELER